MVAAEGGLGSILGKVSLWHCCFFALLLLSACRCQASLQYAHLCHTNCCSPAAARTSSDCWLAEPQALSEGKKAFTVAMGGDYDQARTERGGESSVVSLLGSHIRGSAGKPPTRMHAAQVGSEVGAPRSQCTSSASTASVVSPYAVQAAVKAKIDSLIAGNGVVVFSWTRCPFCKKAK